MDRSHALAARSSCSAHDLCIMDRSLDANGVDSNDHIRDSDFLDDIVDEMRADAASWQRFHDMLHRLDPATSVWDYIIVDNNAMPLSSIVHLTALYGGGRNYPGSDPCMTTPSFRNPGGHLHGHDGILQRLWPIGPLGWTLAKPVGKAYRE